MLDGALIWLQPPDGKKTSKLRQIHIVIEFCNQEGVFTMKTILLIFTLLSCTAWMAAQSTPPSSGSPDTSSPTTGQAGTGQSAAGAGQGDLNGGTTTTLRGCLTSSGAGYTLTDAAGMSYQLSGETSELASHVNNEVELKGSVPAAGGPPAASPTAGTAANAGGGQMFSVTKVKKLSSTCSPSK